MAKKRYTTIDQGHQHEYKVDRYGEGVTLGDIGHTHEVSSGVVFPAADRHTHKLPAEVTPEEE
jgi:hypothetical protein